MMRRIYNSRFIGLAFTSVVILLQHIQAMSFGRYAMDLTKGSWSSDVKSMFGDFENIALRFDDTPFFYTFAASLAVSFFSVIAYFLLHSKIHEANQQQGSLWTLMIWVWEHVVFGCGFIPIIANLTEVQYCDSSKVISSYSDVDCWTSRHKIYYLLGFGGVSLAFFMAGVVFPILKSERKGVEQHWHNESNFPGLYMLVMTLTVVLFAPIQRPISGMCAHAFLIVYLAVFEGYRELHIASLKMGVCFAQLWVFICAKQTEDSSSRGSDLLALWAPALVLGYLVLPLKSLVVKRVHKYQTLPKIVDRPSGTAVFSVSI
jgi:hypothetical protein